MLELILAIALDKGDAEEVSRGTVSLDYVHELNDLTDQLKEREISQAVGEVRFNSIWDKIKYDVGLDGEECMLNLDKRNGEVTEIVFNHEQLHHAVVATGRPARLKAEIM